MYGRHCDVQQLAVHVALGSQFVGPTNTLLVGSLRIGSKPALDDGQIVVGSGSGSQLGAYAYAGGHVILVVGHQKLVRDLDEGLRRVREYSLPREFARMQSAGYPGSLLAKTLIIHNEPSGRINVILVPETLGY